MKKTFSLFLCLCLCPTLFPTTAFADGYKKLTCHSNNGAGLTYFITGDDLLFIEGACPNLPTEFKVPKGKQFFGWNTAADGSGDSYQPKEILPTDDQPTELFAQWYTPTYDKLKAAV